MATATIYQAQVTVTTEQYGRIASGQYTLPAGVTIASATPNPAGTQVTIVFTGSALGSWAVPVPPSCELGLVGTALIIQPIGGSSSSSGIP